MFLPEYNNYRFHLPHIQYLTLNSVYGNSVAGLFPNQLVYILYHFSICAKVEFITIYIFPSGCHGTVCTKVIPASINSLPGICQFASIRSLIVPGISGFHPVCISIRVIIRNPFSICTNPVRTNRCSSSSHRFHRHNSYQSSDCCT